MAGKAAGYPDKPDGMDFLSYHDVVSTPVLRTYFVHVRGTAHGSG